MVYHDSAYIISFIERYDELIDYDLMKLQSPHMDKVS